MPDHEQAREYIHAMIGHRTRISEAERDILHKLLGTPAVRARFPSLTRAELCAIGRASVLVPYPHAADDHQAKNAEALADAGAAIALRQEHATVHALVDALGKLVADDARRVAMADHARARGVPDAALRIADDVLPLHLDRRAA